MRLITFYGLLLAALLIAACGGQQSTQAPPPAATQSNTPQLPAFVDEDHMDGEWQADPSGDDGSAIMKHFVGVGAPSNLTLQVKCTDNTHCQCTAWRNGQAIHWQHNEWILSLQGYRGFEKATCAVQ